MIHFQKPDRDSMFSERLIAIDAMRGVVIVLMALDHASHAFNGGRYVTDSFAMYQPGSVIPTAQFLLRWVTHLCAPTFLFLAGFSLALSITKRQVDGESFKKTDLFLIKRGFFILLLDPIWMSIAFGYGIVFQVLYAIGASFCCMALLRRATLPWLLGIGLGLILFGEGLAGLALWLGGGQQVSPIGAFLVTGGRIGQVAFVLYPLLPWLAFMMLGWSCGRILLNGTFTNTPRFFTITGVLSLLIFCIVRGLNSYGNMLLYRDNNSLIQWLHVSKYPPSLSFSSLELGIMFLLLAFFWVWYDKRPGNRANPLLVFGQTSLFFYVIHVHLLAAAAWLLGLQRAGGIVETVVATVAALMVLYPLCFWFRRIKRSRSDSFWRYL
jgi:uncharacterized membrane protein